MSRYESVEKAIYGDPGFEALSLEASALYLWSFINPQCGLAGLYKVSKARMAESKVPGKKLDRTLAELHLGRFLHYLDGVLWVRSRIKYLPTKGQKLVQPILRDVSMISPRHPLRTALLYHYCVEHRNEFDWLVPILETLNVVPHKTDFNVPQDDSSDESSIGTSSRSVCDLEEEPPTFESQFGQWLAHHAEVTGHAPPAKTTKAYSKFLASFRDRRREGFSLDDLKMAVVGAYNDPFRRENGHYGVESVLRPTKVHDLVQKGRKVGQRSNVTALVANCIGPRRKGQGSCPHGAKALPGRARCDDCDRSWSEWVMEQEGA